MMTSKGCTSLSKDSWNELTVNFDKTIYVTMMSINSYHIANKAVQTGATRNEHILREELVR